MPDNIKVIYKTVKYVNLKVTPNLEVILTVPIGTRQRVISATIAKRQKWIEHQLAFFKTHHKDEVKELVSGENIEYLGKNYRLKIIESPCHSGGGRNPCSKRNKFLERDEERVVLSGGFLQVFVKNRADIKQKKYLIDSWYKEKAGLYFNKIISKYIKIVNKPVNKVSVRLMKTRWGSCNQKKGNINLNPELIKKHISAIEYVIFHELIHLLHYNHDAKFYNYMTSYMPDWQARKNKLLKK